MNPLLPHEALKFPTISVRPSPLARTDWSTAASAAFHSRQYAGNGARVCTRRRATGPPGDDKVALTMYGAGTDCLEKTACTCATGQAQPGGDEEAKRTVGGAAQR